MSSTSPFISFGREICGDLDAGLRREWLVTNGLGGYASGTLAGPNTRRYHGLLVAALHPPVERTVLVAGLAEQAEYDGRRYPLSAHEYGGGVIDPQGYRHLQSFEQEGILPVWTFALADALLERRVWMAYGQNTTYVMYRLLRASRPLQLDVTPLATCRDFHSLWIPDDRRPDRDVAVQERGVSITTPATALHIAVSVGAFVAGGDWYWNFFHREEAARGLDTRSDLYAPGRFRATLRPDVSLTLVLSTEADVPTDGEHALAAARARQRSLLATARAEHADPTVQQLVLAADQFVVTRVTGNGQRVTGETDTRSGSASSAAAACSSAGQESPDETNPLPVTPRTVIAGYHWFNDWGRDTMIALPGLTLATGRPEDAAGILRTFARYVNQGLLPNNFPDRSGEIPGYNTVDATLWYVLAIHAYHAATGDEALVDELLPVLREIVAWHIKGTRYGIGVDPADGLLRAGEPGVQLTWMDAKVGGWVVTPRIGKPVEINALWYNALRILAGFLAARGDGQAKEMDARAEQVRTAFRARFLSDSGSLADVVDGPEGDDWTVRPNQILAVSPPFPLLEGEEARAVVDAVGRTLLTSYGLRSLAPDDPAYRGDYGGDQVRRDGGYHQGPAWSWLIGAYAEAHFRAYGDRAAALALLRPFAHHLRDAGLGTVSEILEGDPPHAPRGCIAQAWSVAEVLRVWRALDGEGSARAHPL